MCLKRSISRKRTASRRWWRWASASARASRSPSSRRFGKSVSGSWLARWDIRNDIARAALMSRSTIAAPVTTPQAVMDRSGRVFDGRLRPVPPDQDAVETRPSASWSGIARSMGSASGLACGAVDDAGAPLERPAGRLGARPARHRFRNLVEIGDPARHVRAEQGVADGIERDLDAFRLGDKRFFRQFPFDGVTERARQPVAVEAIDEKIVVAPRPDDLPCDLFILVRADDENGMAGAAGARSSSASRPRQSGSCRSSNTALTAVRGQSFETLGEGSDPLDLVSVAFRPGERLPNRLGVGGIPADVKDAMQARPGSIHPRLSDHLRRVFAVQ